MSKIKICYLIIALLLIDTSVFSNVSQKNGYDFLPQYILKSGSKETFSIVENGKSYPFFWLTFVKTEVSIISKAIIK